MARDVSAPTRRDINSTSGTKTLELIRINHVDLPASLAFVNDNENVTSNGELFTAIHFNLEPPDDLAQGLPKARLSVDNVGREITDWLDASTGGRGATVDILYVSRATPDVVEYATTLELAGVSQSPVTISGDLGYKNLLALPAVAMQYRPDTAPGVF